MPETYAIAMYNLKENVVLKPLLSNVPRIQKLIIITEPNKLQDEKRREISDFLRVLNVNCEFALVDDLSNFFHIFLLVQKICNERGGPEWVNISCGTGIGLSALTIHAFNRNIPVVVYEEENDRTVMVEIKKLKKINIYDQGYMGLLKSLSEKMETIKMLAETNRTTKSSISRKLRNLISLEIVLRTGFGRRNYPGYDFC